MTSDIFTNLVNAVREAEAEAARLSSTYSQIQQIKGIEQRLAQLRSNEQELTKTLDELALQAAAKRKEIESANEQIKGIIQNAQNEGGKIIEQAHQQKRTILEAANREHASAKDMAARELAEISRKIDAAAADLLTLTSKLADGEDRLARMKKAAAAFAGG